MIHHTRPFGLLLQPPSPPAPWCVCITALQAQLKKAAKEAAKKAAAGIGAASGGKMLYLEKGKDVVTEQL